jgi:alkanesulfonate monooxygenase SsuD/methylene tetrahydromethanopterin reductase-like flavin-dependent oxidoreductase (luciferase family)
MKYQPPRRRLREILDRIRRLLKREPDPDSPDDPYALVGAPKKPRPPHRSAAAAEPLD